MHKEMCLCTRLESVFVCPWTGSIRGCGRWGGYIHVGVGDANQLECVGIHRAYNHSLDL